MTEIRAPIPKRMPAFSTPKSPAPWDIMEAMTQMEHDAYEALVKEPAEAAGITPPPEIPGPGTFASMAASPLQNLLGGLTKAGQGAAGGGGASPEPKRGTARVEPLEVARERHRGTL
jgi:hypothetical protein